MRIKKLSSLLANQIAAGEVIERPASVLKECVENSLDAGATRIDIEVENAGMGLIRIKDNGCGIAKDDLALALDRHATSKIQHVEDLFCIDSLGFRGEALASISSVAKIRLISQNSDDMSSAWELRAEQSQDAQIFPTSHPVGTTIEIRDLFYNVPVRRKFLKSEKTELYHLLEVYKKFVLSDFEVGFSFKSNQRRFKSYAPATSDQNKLSRIKNVCGSTFLDHAIKIDVIYQAMRLWGWVGLVDVAKRQADNQYFFVNKRMVRDKLINHAIKNAYRLMGHERSDLYPSYALYLELPCDQVDVNVHPTKHEVRFVEAAWVHDFIEKCIKEALLTAPIAIEAEATDSTASSIEPTKFTDKQIYTEYSERKFSAPSAVSSAAIHDRYPQPKTIAMQQSPVLPKMHEVISPVIPAPDNSQRFFMLQQEKHIYLCDLVQAQSKLFFHFINTPLALEMKKAVLFPIELPIACGAIETMTGLGAVGFEIRQTGEKAVITHIPFFIDANDVLEIVAHIRALENKHVPAIKEILLSYVDAQAVFKIPHGWLEFFFIQWLSQTAKGPWICLEKHVLIQEIQENNFNFSK
ncbi:DNA mismatch repair endonuclease MutL [Candidatus Berkiella cookevillensis]|uniref:DNA mismatch repair protein MutL n=1 Tax=Candidatus Berkiella cookevillensis TaxID=437022 RepID=A0A0Q9YG74_9GAMM|nr:DNA mismatch repair endonuclease MutL [Candidatus Berkiella cookevillensis]MCS5707548.1 DNA mismatch repair endonuclease MutL [Candidatus Berkiella cookevillensis]